MTYIYIYIFFFFLCAFPSEVSECSVSERFFTWALSRCMNDAILLLSDSLLCKSTCFNYQNEHNTSNTMQSFILYNMFQRFVSVIIR